MMEENKRIAEENQRKMTEESRKMLEETKSTLLEESKKQAAESKKQAAENKERIEGIRGQMNNIGQQMREIQENMRAEVTERLAEQENKMVARNKRMEGQIKEIIYHTREHIMEQIGEQSRRMEDQQEENMAWKEHINNKFDDMQVEVLEVKKKTESGNKKIEQENWREEMKMSIDQEMERMKEERKLWEEQRKNVNTVPTQINVQCTGGSGYEGAIPTFSPRKRNPIEFLNKMRRYMERINRKNVVNNAVNFEEILEVALENEAEKWWQTMKEEVYDMEEFTKRFLEKYWSRDVQKGMRRKIEMEKYRPGGRLGRADYLVERVIVLRQMTPQPDEEEIVNMLCEHFEPQVKDARRVQDIRTIRKFEELLNRIDIEEANEKLKLSMQGTPRSQEDRTKRTERRVEEWNKQPQYIRRENFNGGAYRQGERRPNNGFNSSRNYSDLRRNGQQRSYEGRREESRYIPPHERGRWNNNPYERERRERDYRPRTENRPTEEQQQACRSIRVEEDDRQHRGAQKEEESPESKN